jgi:hypothetical protein
LAEAIPLACSRQKAAIASTPVHGSVDDRIVFADKAHK